ncbi:unnamed protein product [Symbiodinium necroappetens]|uniref:C3H1-type domain-containing protein n=1 Tax=Symbiodinium necroappetens TaxID=1628268 RepID=A0A812LQ86_9DINO|nr:unnamed protein product [Symbiodinium necroappetens]
MLQLAVCPLLVVLALAHLKQRRRFECVIYPVPLLARRKMMPVVAYRNTFLQVPLEERMGEPGHRRAVSVPARLPGQADFQHEPSLDRYLSNVSQSLGAFWAHGIPPALWTGMRNGADQPVEEGEVHQTPDDPIPSAELGIGSFAADEPSFAPPCLSESSAADPGAEKDDERENLLEVLPGQSGHPEFCRRPCILFSAGRCAADLGCKYCHLPHHRKPKLAQAIRWKLEAMRAAERLEILMQILCKKEAGMPRTLPSIQKLITILNEALETADSSRAFSTDRKAVQAVLAKMPVAALLGSQPYRKALWE